MRFVDKLGCCHPQEGQLGIFWLGQAGFLLKNRKGEILAVDPYLSNAVERICGLKRLMMPVMEPEELNPNFLLISHEDEDHLDMDILPDVMKRNPKTRLFAPDVAWQICKNRGIDERQLIRFNQGTKVMAGSFQIEAVFADHGDHAPDAIGMLVETDGIKVYFTGDTSFQEKRMEYVSKKNVDILILPINGEYGNLNATEAVDVVKLMKPKLTIPSHFWMFIRHGSNPYAFDREMRLEAPDFPFYFMCQGEMIIWDEEKNKIIKKM
jgi:L-ascorbate 6-phosphate lactonase